MLQALRKNYPNCKIYRLLGNFIVEDKNLDTKKYEYHVFDAHNGFVITCPSKRMAIKFCKMA